eukprot:s2771_g8.t1
MAQVLSAIRSQPASTDLTPVLNGIRETQELTQGLSYSLRSWRAEIAANVHAPGSSDTNDHVQPGAVSWDSHEVMSDMLTDKLSHQTATIKQFLLDILQRLDFSAVLLAIGEQTADMKAALAEQRGQVTGKLQSLQQQLRGLEPGSAEREKPTRQDMDFSEVLAAIRESARPAAGPQMVDLSEVLDAIRAVPAQVDLSYEFSAVLTAIQDKQPDLDLPAIRSVVTDSKQDILFQLEDVRSLIRSQAQLDPSRSPSRRPQAGKDGDLSTILTAIKDQKVSIDFSVAQVLNNIQQKQQEAIDRMEKTEKQLDHLKEGLQKLNGQELRPRSATPNPTPCSPRCGRFNAQQWQHLPGVETALPAVLGGLKQKEKTEVKVGALRLLALMRDEDTIKPLACQLDRVMPHIAEMLNDVKREVRQTAADAAKVLFECAQNKDLDPYLDEIIKAMMDQEFIPRVVSQLSEIVFVQSVETPALAIVMPLIVRGLKDRDERTKRRALVIADNMCKLVPDVTEIQPFLPTLIPLVEKSTHNISDPEVRNVATRCYRTLQTADKADRRRFISKTAVLNLLQEKIPDEKTQLVSELVADYVASLCTCISACRSFEYAEWWQCIAPYLSPSILSVEDCEDLVPDLLESCYDAAEGDDVEDLDEEGEDLCNCVFTLGYGALTLLNNTRLHLKRGKCYGLCGPNDCGKSTLLRAINNEQVDGFPPKSELVTAFVEHGIGEKEPECEWTPLEYIFADETIQAMGVTKKKVVAALRSIGFDDQKLKSEIGHLSGGWKMKLGLVRAMLMCADILLLDEPTGHLDVANVAWLGDYLLSLSRDSSRPVTTVVVSHDSSFLDKVCTHVINVKQRKLKTYKGNITDFVRRCPEAKSYLSLTNDKQRFVLPEPGMLEGVKSKGKKLLKMHNVTYTYPGNQTPTLFNVSIEVSLLSRVAVIGPNGAGKSTMIKALVGELPVAGKSIVWKHPNVRISYVAQHAFHHVEQHLDITPTQYLLWRFAGGEDREALNYRSEEVSGEKKKYWLNEAGVLCKCTNAKEEAKTVSPELILGRKKSKSKANSGDEKYEYSVKWHGFSSESNMWVPREILLEMGHLRLIQREDERQAAAHGLVSRPLTQPQVEEHLAGFGLDSNLASHTRLGILSGGQKVKVVLGAAMWLSPHILILDEPTNYLDRDSLGALAAGLKEFGGGVIVISHNREFCHAVCDERWLMDAGRLTREGQLSKADVALEGKTIADEYTDEFGNVHKIKKQNHTEKVCRGP